ncbi:MAG: acyltransferase family protein [Parasporobacterium sp.]|nr:acyltransferase family protein [Parasporobacterium sp.]
MSAETVTTTTKREHWIDTAKAIAMICIILGHTGAKLEGWFNFEFVYGFHLVVFFMLSGYTMKAGPLTKDFINKKFSRLMPAYFITCFAVMIMDVLEYFFVFHYRSIETITELIGKDLIRTFFASGTYSEVVSGVNPGVRIGAIWFLPALFFALVLFRFLAGKISNNKLLGIASALISLFGYISARFIWLPFSIQSGMLAVFFLWAGYTVKKNQLLDKVKWYHYLIALALLLIGIWLRFCSIGFVTADMVDLLFSPIVGFSGSLLVYFLAKLLEKSRFLQWLGISSLTVLGVHLFSLETIHFHIALEYLGLHGQIVVWIRIVLELIFAIAGAWFIEFLRKKLYQPLKSKAENRSRKAEKKRDPVIDIERGLLILAMLVGHFDIDSTLWWIIYSCHMVAFVFLSGYFYKKQERILPALKHLVKAFLGPYLVCFILNILIDIPNWSGPYFIQILKKYVLGISYASRVFPDADSIGPVYFILLLFVTRVIYLLIDHFVKTEVGKWVCVFLCTAAGLGLGRFGLWLPWSIDVALYCMVFYQLGIAFRKYGFLEMVRDTHWLYFFLSTVWAYMIYKSSMEIAVRNYGNHNHFGLVILGALAGILVIFRLSAYLARSTFLLSRALKLIGEASLILLVIHTLLSSRLNGWLGEVFGYDNLLRMVFSILIQIIVAVLLNLAWGMLKKKRKALKQS